MKVFLLYIAFLGTISLKAQEIEGAWQRKADSTTITMIIADGHFMETAYTTNGNRFLHTSGGNITMMGHTLDLEIEFNSAKKNEVGNSHIYEFSVDDNTLITRHHDDEMQWTRVDDGKPGLLAGAWLFSGRRSKPDEEIQPYTPGARKTMKIMSGTRFQWAAYNTETKEFSGTGGGTYTTINGKYTENIDFFSRDNSRVGASLSFDMMIDGPHWMHSGKSSKGDPIYERWTRRNFFKDQ